MQIVIEIPKEEYEECKIFADMIKEESVMIDSLGTAVRIHIANGTPLPKGHGRILDEKDILDTKNNDGGWYDLVDMPEYIAGVKAIIKADKEYEVEVITRGNCMMCGKELVEVDGLFFCKECENKVNGRK